MSLWLVVPVKSLRHGKSRLAPLLDAEQRFALMQALLLRTLEQTQQFAGLERTLVISACEETRAFAATCGAHAMQESPPGGLNYALRQAQAALRERGATRMLVIPCDLPLLRAEDLQHLADAPASAIAIAPDRARQGTNGMCLPVDAAFDFCFGPDSFDRHLDGVRRSGLQSSIVEREGLAFDIDIPADLAALHAVDRHAPAARPEIHS